LLSISWQFNEKIKAAFKKSSFKVHGEI